MNENEDREARKKARIAEFQALMESKKKTSSKDSSLAYSGEETDVIQELEKGKPTGVVDTQTDVANLAKPAPLKSVTLPKQVETDINAIGELNEAIAMGEPEKKEEHFSFGKYLKDLGVAGVQDMVSGIYRTPEFLYDIAVSNYNRPFEAANEIARELKIPYEFPKALTSEEIGKLTGVHNTLAEKHEKWAEQLREQNEKYREPVFDNIKEGNYEKAAIGLAGSIAESLPFTLSIILPSAAGVNAMRMAAGVTAVMGAKRKQELQGKGFTEDQENTNAMMHGMGEALDVMFGAGLAGRAIRNVVKKEGVEAGKKFGIKTIEELATKYPALQPFGEAMQESITQVVQNAADIDILGEDKEITSGVADAAITGFAMGGGFTAAQTIAQKLTNKDIAKLAQEPAAFGTAAEESLKNGEITIEEAEDITAKATRYEQILPTVPQDLDIDTKAEVVPLIDERNELDAQIEQKEVEKQALDEVFTEKVDTEISELQKKRESLVNTIKGIITPDKVEEKTLEEQKQENKEEIVETDVLNEESQNIAIKEDTPSGTNATEITENISDQNATKQSDRSYLPKYGNSRETKTQNIDTAKELLNDLGVNASFSGYSDTNGVSVYFEDPNGRKIRISDHSVTSKERMGNEILLYFDAKTLGLGGKEGFKSNLKQNRKSVESLLSKEQKNATKQEKVANVGQKENPSVQVEELNSAIEQMRKENPSEFKKDGTPKAKSKLLPSFKALNDMKGQVLESMRETFTEDQIAAEQQEREKSKAETEAINKSFEERQEELSKGLTDEEKTDAIITDKLAQGTELTDQELEYANENFYLPKGYEFDKSGSLTKVKNDRQDNRSETTAQPLGEIGEPNKEQNRGSGKESAKRNDGKGKDRIAKGVSDLVDAIGAKKNLTGEEKKKASDALYEIGMGLIEEGIATAQNVAEKVVEYLKKQGVTLPLSKEEIDSVFREPVDKTDPVTKTLVGKRAFEGEIRAGVKKNLEEIGLTREVDKLDVAKERATELVDSIGEQSALDAVRNGDIQGATAAYVYDAITRSINKQLATETDQVEIDRLERIQADLLEEWGNKQWKSGAFNSAMQKILVESELGYNSKYKANQWKQEFGQEPSKEMMETWKERDAQLKELEKKLAIAEQRAKEAEEKQALMNIKEAVDRARKQPEKSIKESSKALAEKIRQAKLSRPGVFMSATPASVVWDGAIEVVATTVEAGGTMADAIERGVKFIKDSDWYKSLSKENAKKAIDDYTKAMLNSTESQPTDRDIRIPHALIRQFVESGIDNIDDLTKSIMGELKDVYPDITEREVRDAITGYGKVVNPNMEDVEVQIRKMKRIGRTISALEDVQRNKRPLRSGRQRDKLDAQERALTKQLRELMKGLPLDAETEAIQLRTQLDAAKARIQNSIEDLQREIDRKELTPKSAKTIQEDSELKDLREKRDALKLEHEKMFKDEEFKQQRRLELTKKATQRRIEDLQKKLRNKDFAKKKTKPLIEDSELIQLRAEKLRVQEEYDKEFYKEKLRNRTADEKIKDSLWEIWGIPRVVMATGEASFVGIQGLTQTVAHPITAAKAMENAIKFFSSEAKAEKWLSEIKAQEWYPVLKKSKLALTEPHAELTAREELFYSGWSNLFWNGLGRIVVSPMKFKGSEAYKIAQRNWNSLNPLKATERAAIGYLDMIRVERFLDGMEILKMQGKTFETHPKDYQNMADVINTMTGRASLGPLEQQADLLSKVFFSPRNWASGIKTATPYALFYLGGKGSIPEGESTLSMALKGKFKPSVAQKMMIADFSKFLGVMTSITLMVAAALNNDDDDETNVEFDPRSTDFMKIRLGKKRIDIWGGKQQQVVLSARIMADALMKSGIDIGGAYKRRDELLPLGVPYKSPSAGKLIGQQTLNKLNPTASLLYNYMNTSINSDGVRVNDYGEEYSIASELEDKYYPIFWGTVKELLIDNPSALNGLLVFYAFFGGGILTYDSKSALKFERGTKEHEILNKYSDLTIKKIKVPNKMGEIELTDVQKDKFKEISDKKLKESIRKNYNTLKKMDKDELKSYLEYYKKEAEYYGMEKL